MYNFSGIWYRVWGVAGFIFLMGIVLILLEKPWKNKFSIKKYGFQIVCIVFGVVMGLKYIFCIITPNIIVYTGEYVESYRNSRVAPPLPLTMAYTFFNEDENYKYTEFYLDVLSKKEIFDGDLQYGASYTVFYDEFTHIIVRIDLNNTCTLCVYYRTWFS